MGAPSATHAVYIGFEPIEDFKDEGPRPGTAEGGSLYGGPRASSSGKVLKLMSSEMGFRGFGVQFSVL